MFKIKYCMLFSVFCNLFHVKSPKDKKVIAFYRMGLICRIGTHLVSVVVINGDLGVDRKTSVIFLSDVQLIPNFVCHFVIHFPL